MRNTTLAGLTLAMLFAASSCSEDNNTLNNATGTGDLTVEFDNSFAGNDLILQTQGNTTSNGEVLHIAQIKYIVSNIVLTDASGNHFTYNKSDSYFIVNESDANSLLLNLHNIPAADYTQITFGVGVDEAQWAQGADGQGDLLAWADAQDMLWSWSAGYKFLMFEGEFTSGTVTAPTPFMVHTGKTGTAYNYAPVTLSLPQKALVRQDITPEIHIVADLSKIIDGTNKIKLSDNNTAGAGAMIMGGENVTLISQNLPGMFQVAHVHND